MKEFVQKTLDMTLDEFRTFEAPEGYVLKFMNGQPDYKGDFMIRVTLWPVDQQPC